MEIPDTFVYGYLKDNVCLLVDKNIYTLKPGGSDFVFGRAGFKAVKAGSVALLESAYLERHDVFVLIQREMLDGIEKDAARFREKFKDKADSFIRIAKMVFDGRCEEKTRSAIINSILREGDFFNYHGILFPLFPSAEGDAVIEGRAYCIGMNPSDTAENLEKHYKNAIMKEMSRKALDKSESGLIKLIEDGFYDKKNEVGIRVIDGSLYAFTRINPYVLYERKNGKYYQFPAAEAGASITLKNGRVVFGVLKVISPYKHPSLQYIGKPMQPVCLGEYNLETIMRGVDEPREQVVLLMRKARKALASEFRSRGKPYHFLTEKAFDDLIVENPDKRNVCNGD